MPDIKTKFTLAGEKEYRDALSQINGSMRVMNAEMKATKAAFIGSEESMESLSAQSDILNRQLGAQKDKVAVLRQAVEESASVYGEADARTQKWKTSLFNAETELHKTEAAIRGNEAEMEKLGNSEEELSGNTEQLTSSAAGLGDALGTVGDKLGIKVPESIKKFLNSAGSMKAGTVAAAAGVAALTAAIVKAEKALLNTTKASAAYADEILTLSAQTGLATGTLQEFSYASELLDVSVDTIQGSLTKLTRNMGEAAGGSDAAKEAFDRLGISITNADGSLRTSEDVFYEAVDALGEIENYTERDAIAMDVFGKSAQDLNPLIIQGTERFKDLAEEAHKTGYVLEEDTLSALGEVDDAIQRLDKRKEAFKNSMAAEFAPSMTEAIDGINESIGEAGDALVESGAVEAFGSILTSATALIEPLTTLATGTLPVLGDALYMVAYVTALIADTLTLITSLLRFDFKGAGTALGLNMGKGQLSNIQKLENREWLKYNEYSAEAGGWVSKYSLGQNAGGTDNWRGGMTLVGENGPELVSLPRGSSVATAQETRSMGGDTFYVIIDAKSVDDFNRVVKLARDATYKGRMK